MIRFCEKNQYGTSVEMPETLLSERRKQILVCMELEVLYKTEEIAEKIGLKEPRTR